MKFEERPPTEWSIAKEWWAEKNYGIGQLKYAYGQKRIQFWFKFDGMTYIDTIGPEY